MYATPFEFRFRYVIQVALIIFAFVVPWNHISRDTWSWLMIYLPAHSTLRIDTVSVLALEAGIFFALAAAALRTWGTAYIGASIVQDQTLHGSHVVATGPYRYIRNPLYVGTFLHLFALALLMHPTGALFVLITSALFQLRLVIDEETFLASVLRQPYLDYKARVPRLIPALKPQIPASNAKGSWGLAALSEIYFWGVALTFAILGWSYEARPLIKGIIISLGISIRGPRSPSQTHSAIHLTAHKKPAA